MRSALWVAGCLVVGALVCPASYLALWAMRANFLGTYDELRTDCERVSEMTITDQMEGDGAAALAAHPSLAASDYCKDLLEALDGYRQAVFTRSVGFGVVVFIGLLIVRFIMFPAQSTPGWIESA